MKTKRSKQKTTSNRRNNQMRFTPAAVDRATASAQNAMLFTRKSEIQTSTLLTQKRMELVFFTHQEILQKTGMKTCRNGSLKCKISAFNLRVLLLGFVLSTFPVAASQTLAERLGYPPGTRLIIVHADDLGETHAVDAAAIKALQGGTINSASLMSPCPWFPEIADYAKSNPNVDFGLHLTLTSERVYYRWGPVAPTDEVPSLVDENGDLANSLRVLSPAIGEDDSHCIPAASPR